MEKKKKEKKNYADGKAVGIAAARADGQRRGSVTCQLCRRLPSAYILVGALWSVTCHPYLCRRPPVTAVGIDLTSLAGRDECCRRARIYADGLYMPSAAVGIVWDKPTAEMCRWLLSA